MSEETRISLLREGTLRTDDRVGFPQKLSISINGVSFEFRFVWNKETESMMLTISRMRKIYFKSKLVTNEKMIVYAPPDFFASHNQKTIATITPLYIGPDYCELKIIWMKRN